MKFYLVGIDKRSATHDYAALHAAIGAVHGRRVSRRIWMCVVNRANADALKEIYQRLAAGDQLMVVEVPPTMRLPKAVPLAA